MVKTSQQYLSGYLSDTLTLGNLTVNARRPVRPPGRQEPDVGHDPANPVVPDLLPAVTTIGGRTPFTWENVVPRIGLTYALGQDNKTLLRASYSQYADQLGANAISFANAGRAGGPLLLLERRQRRPRHHARRAQPRTT